MTILGLDDVSAQAVSMATTKRPLNLIFMEDPHGMNSYADWWALGWHESMASTTGVDRWYEIHHPRIWHNGMTRRLCEPERYAGWLTSLKGEKVVAPEAVDRVSGSVAFPFNDVTAIPGVRNYLASSMAFMLCHAVLEGYRDIAILGCDFSQPQWQERLFEKPNLAYLIGLFRARGIKVTVPQSSTLWECELLDEYADDAGIMPIRSQSKMKRFHQMYCYGRWVGREPEASKYMTHVNSVTALPWKFWPYYGAESLEEVDATPRRYAADLRHEMGVEL